LSSQLEDRPVEEGGRWQQLEQVAEQGQPLVVEGVEAIWTLVASLGAANQVEEEQPLRLGEEVR
jgi:hypothetical protein